MGSLARAIVVFSVTPKRQVHISGKKVGGKRPFLDALEVIRHLCTELNETETIFPGTKLRLVYKLVSD